MSLDASPSIYAPSSQIDHAARVLSGILNGSRRDRLAQANSVLIDDHFQDPVLRVIWTFVLRYYDLTAHVVSEEAFRDLLARRGTDEGKLLLYTERLKSLAATPVADHEFKYAIQGLRDIRAHVETGETLATAMEILTAGATVDRRDLLGHEDAREYLYSALTSIDRLDKADHAPEGDMRTEARDILSDYADRKAGRGTTGVRSGIPFIDNTTNGFANGEMWLIAAYTGQGKTQFCSQTAWDVCVKQGKNVFFATSETQRTQVRRRIIARHSRQPQFGLPKGLDSKKIRLGTLNADEERILQEVIEDFTTNPNYGRLHIAQVPRGATLSFVEARANRFAQVCNVDLEIIDYIALLKSEAKRASSREELSDVLKDAKMHAVAFQDGNGVPLLSPWQMSQAALQRAETAGVYTLASLSDTSEAEKSADGIIPMLRMPDNPREVRLGFLKSRDSDTPEPATLECDYRTSYIGPKETVDSVSSLIGDDDGAFEDFEADGNVLDGLLG
jgi:replicative DNA helicase